MGISTLCLNLIEPSESFLRAICASIVAKWKCVRYHFYDAVGKNGGIIAQATSKNSGKLKKQVKGSPLSFYGLLLRSISSGR